MQVNMHYKYSNVVEHILATKSVLFVLLKATLNLGIVKTIRIFYIPPIAEILCVKNVRAFVVCGC